MHERTEFAIRRNKGRAILSQFLEKLEDVLGRPVTAAELMSLEKTDEVLFLLRDALSTVEQDHGKHVGSYKTTTVEELRYVATEWGRCTPPREVCVFRTDSEFCGALRVSSAEVLNKIDSLLTLDSEDVLACSEDGSYGITCQWSSPKWNRTDQNLYEFLGWTKTESDTAYTGDSGE